MDFGADSEWRRGEGVVARRAVVCAGPMHGQQSRMSTASVRPLTPSDAAAFVGLRHEMLADSPWAFAASPEDDVGVDPAFIAARLGEPGQAIVGAFEVLATNASAPHVESSVRFIAAAGLVRSKHVKMAHRANLWGVYITPAWRGRGLATRLIGGVFDVARSWPGVTSISLSVSARSPEALRLYKRWVSAHGGSSRARWSGTAADTTKSTWSPIWIRSRSGGPPGPVVRETAPGGRLKGLVSTRKPDVRWPVLDITRI